MGKGKKGKRNRQCSNAPVPDPLNAGDSSDSGELKSQPTNSESTPSCNKLHWSSSRFARFAFNVNLFFVLVLKHPCSHVNKAVNINTVRKRLLKVILQCSESECKNNTIEVRVLVLHAFTTCAKSILIQAFTFIILHLIGINITRSFNQNISNALRNYL